ncbi:XRE family transcriptional regulator [Glycomyces sp. TRM65418]|uniref:helix-turn-helix domain-containing protein n=1 Tax=Glycomyces sp. TRM65418 TaxID=2867006 RepID=UPI001CE63756|nr:XRE family transcriptional regulator [Glycomyces sp. TRM65418]MCC3762667.1 XRE family transcriptional regulator [Glycomyces sp. TRM65418]QZD56703.1 XRE family transcriptional regulator [Glycomyces sp. TRM65418]
MTHHTPNRYRASDAAALFEGHRLTIARHLAGWKKSQLAEAVGKSPAAVSAWELGTKRPTPQTVAQLAMVLQVSPGFFVGRKRGSELRPHFRSLRSTTQVARDQASAYGELANDVAEVFETYVEFPKPAIPSCPVSEDDAGDGPEAAARFVRESWSLGLDRIKNTIRLVENQGILVVFSPARAAAVDAYSFAMSSRSVIILSPLKNDYYRQRFDVAHELGHLVMHEDSEPGSRAIEEQANRFAAEFLAPIDAIQAYLPSVMSGYAWSQLGELKEHWGISIQALLYRARQVGKLSASSYRNAMTTVTNRGWRRKEPGLITTLEAPSLIPRALELVSDEGPGESAILQQTGIPAELFQSVTARWPTLDDDEKSATSEEPIHASAVSSLLHHRTNRISSLRIRQADSLFLAEGLVLVSRCQGAAHIRAAPE